MTKERYTYLITISPTISVYLLVFESNQGYKPRKMQQIQLRIPVETSKTVITLITTRAGLIYDPSALSTNSKLTSWVVISIDRKNSKCCSMSRPVENASIPCRFTEVDMKSKIKTLQESNRSDTKILLFVCAMQDQCYSCVNYVSNHDMFRCKR